MAYLLLHLSAWSASLALPDNPSTTPSADCPFALGPIAGTPLQFAVSICVFCFRRTHGTGTAPDSMPRSWSPGSPHLPASLLLQCFGLSRGNPRQLSSRNRRNLRLTPHTTSKDFRLRCILVPSVHRLISRFSVRSAHDFV